MGNVERYNPPKKNISNPFAAGLLSASISMASISSDAPAISYINSPFNETQIQLGINIPRETDLIRQPNQMFGIFAYGHREKEMILSKGDIADGFKPINGENYTEEDVKLIFDQFRQLKYSNIDFVVYSWHSIDDVRDKYFDFLLEVMDRPDNPYPDLKVSIIYELDSNIPRIPEDILNADIEYIKKKFFSNNHYLTEVDGKPIMYVFSSYLEGIIDNPSHVKDWLDVAQKYDFSPILEAYFGNTLNPDHDELKWYQYADEIWDLFPTGISITGDIARVNVAYSKPGDLKNIPFNKEVFKRNLIEAIRSGKTVVVVSWNEYYENTHAQGRNDAIEIMHDVFPQRDRTYIAASGDQFIRDLDERIKNMPIDENIPSLPPAHPNEHLLYVLLNEKPRRRMTK